MIHKHAETMIEYKRVVIYIEKLFLKSFEKSNNKSKIYLTFKQNWKIRCVAKESRRSIIRYYGGT